MIYILPILAYFIWLYFKSKSGFFLQNRERLAVKRKLLIDVLEDRGVDTDIFLEAYDAFKNFPTLFRYDGATILSDLDTIKGLDASAMVHDYQYQRLQYKGFWYYLKGKLKADVEFGKNMRLLGITWLVAWSRVIALILSTPFRMLIVFAKGKLRKPDKFDHFSDGNFCI